MPAKKGNKYAVGNKGGGRRPQYIKSYNDLAYKYCLLGATNAQLADYFGVTEQSINRWKNKYKDFKFALQKGKQVADAEVAHQLFKRATGYKHPEDKIFCNSDGEVTTVKTTKHYPPDTGAAFIWLKNRAGWRDRQDQVHSGEVTLAQAVARIVKDDKAGEQDDTK